ncbi:MAG: hypothetical protein EBR82_29890 [Caulobacteraceae bacterium]|nr:hypothetical protein [Caulobacteraceae bacterium]
MSGENRATAESFLMPTSRQSGPSGGALAKTDSDRGVAAVQAAMAIAKRFPRDTVDSVERIMNACTRPSLAEGALYSYSRGGSDVTGPSIRLAEAIAQQWGNLDVGVRELEQDEEGSTVEAYAWDLETNTRISKVFHVPHVRHTKTGSRPLTDPRDIYENVANNGARRLRACILGVIPGDVVEAAVQKCEETLRTKCDVGPEAQRKLLEAFREKGVTRDQIEKRIQCRVEAIRPAQMVQMRKIYASMRDGMSAAADWFEPVAPAGSGSGAAAATVDALTSGQGKALGDTKPLPAETTWPAAQNQDPHDDGGPTLADLMGTVEHAPSRPAEQPTQAASEKKPAGKK